MSQNLKYLIAKLDDSCRLALEAAASLCVARTNFDVDVEHLLLALLDREGNDLHAILRYFEVDASRFSKDLNKAVDRLKRGNTRGPTLSPRVTKTLTEAWTIASIEFSASRVRSAMLMLALLTCDDLTQLVTESSTEFLRINAAILRQNWNAILASSVDSAGGGGSEAAAAPGAAGNSTTPNLDQYTIDLTAAAQAGKVDPVFGRDSEVRQVIDILTRRRQNNPILTGEAGVGKTAIVEGFALKIASGDVHPSLRNVSLRVLDLGLLQAGAGIRGEFENRLKSVISDIKAAPQPIILFIDEAHTMIGAGGTAGQGDAANLLKPALARGELRTIAATTQAEYKKYFEKDAALARRFQVVKVDEPSEEQAIDMLRGVSPTLERHHRVRVMDEAVEAAVRLSHRYISGRQLPDKAVSILDTACARVSLSQTGAPPLIEDARRRVAELERQIVPLQREMVTGTDHSERLDRTLEDLEAARDHLREMEARWEREKTCAASVLELYEAMDKDPRSAPGLREKLQAAKASLAQLQGEDPLVTWCVDAQTVAGVIASWTGIPVRRMLRTQISAVLGLESTLGERIIGQSSGIAAIARRISTSRAGLDDPARPTGVFLLVGPSGVGKTETALTLAEVLYGGERNIVQINMAEYQEPHTVSGLKGSPAGYVGYGEGGVLTEAVRRRPYTVVLLDEMEKAHPDVMELFYQVFDKGRMEDAEGREIDFRNTLILVTTNAASDRLLRYCSDPDRLPAYEELRDALVPELQRVFKPALLARMIVVPYYPISDDALRRIIELKLQRVANRMMESHRVAFTYSQDVVDAIAERCKEVESGARRIDHVLTDTLLPEISTRLLTRMANSEPVGAVSVGCSDGGAFSYEIS